MGEVINLRQARKSKSRDEKARLADENRARHGRNKAEKQLDRLSAEKSNVFLDGHKRTTPTSPSRGEVAPQRGAGGGASPSPASTVDTARDPSADSGKPRDR